MQETRVQSLGQEDPLEKEMVTHSSILVWRSPWTEEPGGLQSRGLQRVRLDWQTNTFMVIVSITTFIIFIISGFTKSPHWTYIYLWLIHIDVWQKTTRFYKAIILQLKNKQQQQNDAPPHFLPSGKHTASPPCLFPGYELRVLSSLDRRELNRGAGRWQGQWPLPSAQVQVFPITLPVAINLICFYTNCFRT